jgi:hypothetical protein
MHQMQYYSKTYLEARSKFVSCLKKDAKETAHLRLTMLNQEGGVHQMDYIPRLGMQNEELFIDIGVYGNVEHPKAMLIHTSGVHGPEGYCGSAIQIQQLTENSEEFNLMSDVCIVFIHAVNPYGMSWHRRWNESNVDLNRNFFYSELNRGNGESEYEKRGTSEDYCNVNLFFNPDISEIGKFDHLTFYANAAMYIFQHGFDQMGQTLTCGQNKYPTGIFFGGVQLEQEPQLLMNWLSSFLDRPEMKGIEKIVHVDVHTGLGKFAEDTLIINEKIIPDCYRTAFEEERLSPLGELAYDAVGDIGQGLKELCSARNITYYFVCQEFGTYRSVSVLRALRWENAAWHDLGEQMSHDHPAKTNLMETFYPSNIDWRVRVAARGCIVLLCALKFARSSDSSSSAIQSDSS